MRIRIDNVTDDNIAPAHRVPRKELDDLRDRLLDVQNGFRAEAAAGPDTLIQNLRAWTKSHARQEDVDRVIEVAALVRERAEASVTVGIGGSDLVGRTVHAVLDSSQHNTLPREERGGAPEMYFCGDTFDPAELHDILHTLSVRGILLQTVFNVISKSGTTAETIAAFLIIRQRLQEALAAAGRDPAEYAQQVAVTTGLTKGSALFRLDQEQPQRFLALLPVPDGVGGRFSFGSPVGLLALAVGTDERKCTVAERVSEAVRGMRDAESDAYLDPGDSRNLGFRLGSITYLSLHKGKSTLVFYPYAKVLRAVGDWYTQLLSESIQERGGGQNIIATAGPTGNHSLLNGIINGPRDKLLVFVRVVEHDPDKDIVVPREEILGPTLAALGGFHLGILQDISFEGTETDLLNNSVPTCTIEMPVVDTYHLFRLFYGLAVAVAVEGELRELGRLTYEQSAVDGYKREFKRIISLRSRE